MEEGLKNSTELMRILSETQTLISIGDKKFVLNEMSIGRARNFGIKFIKIIDAVQEKTGVDVSKMEMTDLLKDYGDMIFVHLTDILNWLFSYKNSEYVKISKAWVENNVSIRMTVEIVKEIARQNNLSWLIPFFQEKFQIALKVIKE
jgi:hypothetical protein